MDPVRLGDMIAGAVPIGEMITEADALIPVSNHRHAAVCAKLYLLAVKRHDASDAVSSIHAEHAIREFTKLLGLRKHPAVLTAVMKELAEVIEQFSDEVALTLVTEIRRIVSVVDNPPNKLVIAAGLVPVLLRLMQRDGQSKLQFESAWAVTNIASGDHSDTIEVVEAGGIALFIELMTDETNNADVIEQAAWGLGNIAGDGSELRDAVLEAGVVPPLLKYLCNEDSRLSLKRNLAWLLQNIHRASPHVDLTANDLPLVPAAIQPLLEGELDVEVAADLMWSLSYRADVGPVGIDSILETPGLVQAVARIITRKEDGSRVADSVLISALRLIGNIATGDDVQTMYLVHAGVVDALVGLTIHRKQSICKEAFWTISNIAASGPGCAGPVVTSPLFAETVDVILKPRPVDWRTVKEACFGLANILQNARPALLIEVINGLGIDRVMSAVVVALCRSFDNGENGATDLTYQILEGLAMLFRAPPSEREALAPIRAAVVTRGLRHCLGKLMFCSDEAPVAVAEEVAGLAMDVAELACGADWIAASTAAATDGSGEVVNPDVSDGLLTDYEAGEQDEEWLVAAKTDQARQGRRRVARAEAGPDDEDVGDEAEEAEDGEEAEEDGEDDENEAERGEAPHAHIGDDSAFLHPEALAGAVAAVRLDVEEDGEGDRPATPPLDEDMS